MRNVVEPAKNRLYIGLNSGVARDKALELIAAHEREGKKESLPSIKDPSLYSSIDIYCEFGLCSAANCGGINITTLCCYVSYSYTKKGKEIYDKEAKERGDLFPRSFRPEQKLLICIKIDDFGPEIWRRVVSRMMAYIDYKCWFWNDNLEYSHDNTTTSYWLRSWAEKLPGEYFMMSTCAIQNPNYDIDYDESRGIGCGLFTTRKAYEDCRAVGNERNKLIVSRTKKEQDGGKSYWRNIPEPQSS